MASSSIGHVRRIALAMKFGFLMIRPPGIDRRSLCRTAFNPGVWLGQQGPLELLGIDSTRQPIAAGVRFDV